MKINWLNQQSYVFLNPRFKSNFSFEDTNFENLIQSRKGHVWLASSGSSSSPDLLLKLVGLAKSAILKSAASVNDFLASSSRDIWIQALPEFHIGGLSIEARAFLSGAKVVAGTNGSWDPKFFHQTAVTSGATLSSLVPAQVFDLIRLRLECPDKMRAVFVGGDAISESLLEHGRKLGWPLLPTYGMTECASQVATFEKGDKRFKILPHLKVNQDMNHNLIISGESLFTGYIKILNLRPDYMFYFEDPKVDGCFITEDRGWVDAGYLQVDGRANDFVKVGGEGVYLNRLRSVLQSLVIEKNFIGDVELIANGDERLGRQVECLLATQGQAGDELVAAFNERVMPFERIKKVIRTSQIERSSLGKILPQGIELH